MPLRSTRRRRFLAPQPHAHARPAVAVAAGVLGMAQAKAKRGGCKPNRSAQAMAHTLSGVVRAGCGGAKITQALHRFLENGVVLGETEPD